MSNTGWQVSSIDLINVYDSSYKSSYTQSVVTGYVCQTTGKDLGSIFTLNTALSSAGITSSTGVPCGLVNGSTDIGTFFVNSSVNSVVAAFSASSAVVDTNSNVVALPDQFNNFNNLAQTSSGTVNITLTNTNSVGVSSGNSTINNKNLPLIYMPGGNCFMYNPINTQSKSIGGFICVIYPMSNTSVTTLNNLISANLSNGVSFRYPVSLSDPSVLNSADIIANNGNSAVYVNGTNTNLIYDNTNKYVIMYVKFPAIAGLNFVIGSSFVSRGFYGYIGDLYYLSSSHTSADQQIMEGYLASKWGMQNLLPTSHPFYSSKPTISWLDIPSPAYSSITSINGIAAVYNSSYVVLNGSNLTSWLCNSALYNLTSSSAAGTITSIAYPNNNNLYMVSFASGGVSYISQPTNQLSSINGFICVIYPTAMSGSFSYLFCPNGPTNDLSFRYAHYGAIVNRNAQDVDYPNSSVYVNGVPTVTYNNANQYTILYVKFPVISSCGITFGSIFQSRGYTGYIGDFVFLNSTHTNTDRIMLEGVLAKKWGLQTKLPSSHPFSSTAPFIYLPTFNYGGLLASAPTGCQALYACNWVNNGYPGAILNIRRSSDNATQDFYMDLTGTIVTTNAFQGGTIYSSWIGSSTAYVTTWYDQSGLGNHATQTTTTLQPTLVLSSGVYYINFSSGQYFNIANAPVPGDIKDCTIAYKVNSYTNNTGIVVGAGDTSQFFYCLSVGSYAGKYSTDYYGNNPILNLSIPIISNATTIYNISGSVDRLYVTPNSGITATYTTTNYVNLRHTNSLPGNNFIGKSNTSLNGTFQGQLSYLFIGNTIITSGSTDYNILNNIQTPLTPTAPINLSIPSGCQGLFACKWVNYAYTGAILNIRRSNDNVTQDFYIDFSGTIITTQAQEAGTSLSSWLNGATAYVKTWYDQSGSGNHATQTTTASQPSFSLSAKAIDFSSPANAVFNLPNGTVPYGNSSYSLFFKIITNKTNAGVLLFTGGGGKVGTSDSTIIRTETTTTMANWWDGVYRVTTPDTTIQNCGFIYDNTVPNIKSYVNNILTNTFSTSTQGVRNALSTPVMIGNGGGYFDGQFLNNQVQNILIFNRVLTSTEMAIINQI